MRALVAGGAGHIGSHLCESLLADGHEVVCVDNLSTGDRENVRHLEEDSSFTLVQADVDRDFDAPPAFDVIYHLASPASPPTYGRLPLQTLAVNSIGTWRLLDIAERDGAKLVFASTSEVYGEPLVHPQDEAYWGHVNPNGPRSCYDEAKRFGEALVSAFVREGRVDARIVRIFNTYGPNSRLDDGRMIPNFINQALAGQALTIYGSGDQTRSFCYVTDTVEGIRRAAEPNVPPGEVINVGNPEEHSVAEFARAVAEATGVPLRVEHYPIPPDDPTRRCPDITKARRLLGWEPTVSLEDGLFRTVEWFRPRVSEGVQGVLSA